MPRLAARFAAPAILGLALAASGCAGGDGASMGRIGGAPAIRLTTQLLTPGGESLGTATVTQETDGTSVVADVRGLPPGRYAMHLHAVGRCDAPDFTSAGPHFNPAAKQHGGDNPMGSHAGDLPNITIAADGRGRLEALRPNLRIADGATPLLDADGAAVVVHAAADDYRTDPSGNAGARIACGVIRRGA